MKAVAPVALFRLSVLGPLVSRERLERGALQQLIRELALREYAIPGSQRRWIGEKTLEAWYYAWRRDGLEGLVPKPRHDRGRSKLPAAVQAAVLAAKRDNPRRSIRPLRPLLERSGKVARGTRSRSAIHRLWQQHGWSCPAASARVPEAHRRFVAEHANAIGYGAVRHGPTMTVTGRRRKVYLVSLMDDAARLIAPSAVCTGETALDIEDALKQAVLKRGLPRKRVVDNGAAYRAATLQGLCARLDVRLIYGRPYAPEGKGKLERWHRTFRDHFLNERDSSRRSDLEDLNARLWAWIEPVYHRRPHDGLDGQTPLARYQQDLPNLRLLGQKAARLDALFHHRLGRKVRRDDTVAYQGRDFEVPYERSGKTVQPVVDPHEETVVGVEDAHGRALGAVTLLDPLGHVQRRRRRSAPDESVSFAGSPAPGAPNGVELAYRQYHGQAPQEEH